MRYYLSGPMTGLERHGFPAFFEAAAALRERGLEIISPAEMSIAGAKQVMADGMPGYEFAEYADAPELYEEIFARIPREEFLAADGIAVIQADAVVVLPGWEDSDGARWEVSLARKLNKSILEYPTLATVPEPQADRRADASGAVKADVGKSRVDLLPTGPLMDVGQVLGFGATKYAPHNWRRGFEWSRMYGAALRHLFAWAEGEDLDPESGLPHLAHSLCDILFLAEFARTRTGTDDRYKRESTGAAEVAPEREG